MLDSFALLYPLLQKYTVKFMSAGLFCSGIKNSSLYI